MEITSQELVLELKRANVLLAKIADALEPTTATVPDSQEETGEHVE